MKANDAKRKTDEATQAVQGALDQVNQIMDDISKSIFNRCFSRFT